MDKIALIKAEIERRIETYKKGYANGDDRRADALELLLSFLSTIESEKPSDGLEEEYKDYVESDPVYSKLVNRYAGLSIARHFAEWQYQKDRGKFAEIKAKTWSEGFDACKEQMVKEAVEGYVTLTLTGVRTVAATIKGEDNIGPGDKVHIIIVKEEGGE